MQKLCAPPTMPSINSGRLRGELNSIRYRCTVIHRHFHKLWKDNKYQSSRRKSTERSSAKATENGKLIQTFAWFRKRFVKSTSTRNCSNSRQTVLKNWMACDKFLHYHTNPDNATCRPRCVNLCSNVTLKYCIWFCRQIKDNFLAHCLSLSSIDCDMNYYYWNTRELGSTREFSLYSFTGSFYVDSLSALINDCQLLALTSKFVKSFNGYRTTVKDLSRVLHGPTHRRDAVVPDQCLLVMGHREGKTSQKQMCKQAAHDQQLHFWICRHKEAGPLRHLWAVLYEFVIFIDVLHASLQIAQLTAGCSSWFTQLLFGLTMVNSPVNGWEGWQVWDSTSPATFSINFATYSTIPVTFEIRDIGWTSVHSVCYIRVWKRAQCKWLIDHLDRNKQPGK